MNINWQSAQDKFNRTIDAIGTEIQWLQRIVSGSDTGSTPYGAPSYGYQDSVTYWTTGSATVILAQISTNEVFIDPGHYQEDYLRMQTRSDSEIAHMDRVIIPSGSGVIYHVMPFYEWRGGSIIINRYATLRRITPRSGSVY